MRASFTQSRTVEPASAVTELQFWHSLTDVGAEEINRLVTDAIADLLLTPSSDADENLKREGVSESRIRLVGNVMIDSLLATIPKARSAAQVLAAVFGALDAVFRDVATGVREYLDWLNAGAT